VVQYPVKVPKVEIRVYRAGLWESFKFPAGKGSGYTEHGVHRTVALFMAEMEREFPHIIFRVVRTGPGRFNVLPDMIQTCPTVASHA
jgi:hypothetical protein